MILFYKLIFFILKVKTRGLSWFFVERFNGIQPVDFHPSYGFKTNTLEGNGMLDHVLLFFKNIHRECQEWNLCTA